MKTESQLLRMTKKELVAIILGMQKAKTFPGEEKKPRKVYGSKPKKSKLANCQLRQGNDGIVFVSWNYGSVHKSKWDAQGIGYHVNFLSQRGWKMVQRYTERDGTKVVLMSR